MSSPARAWSNEAEVDILKGLRAQYESKGFDFTIAPDRSLVPSFLGSYMPDALAQKQGRNIAIEVRRHQTRSVQARLQDIRRLFDGHPDWQFSVVFVGSGPQEIEIPAASPAAIRARMGEIRRLSELGHQRPAFVMAWSLLEAALQSVHESNARHALTPEAVIQALAMNGYIDADTEQRIRALIALRNRIVHGDVAAEPAAEDVAIILQAIEETLVIGAA